MPTVTAVPMPKPVAPRVEAQVARSVLLVALDDALKGDFCVLPIQGSETALPAQTTFMLDGSVSSKKIRDTVRDLGWRVQRGNLCYVVVPSEDVLLLIEEFPSKDTNEVRVMAEGLVQSMVELNADEHVLLIHEIHVSESSTVCALAVFARKRLQRIFESVQKLGITNPRFVLDVVGVWQVSQDVVANGFWGRVVKDEGSPKTIVKCLKVVNGVIRSVRQRFYYREQIEEEWLSGLFHELFPDELEVENDPGITWYVSHRSGESPAHLVDLCRLAAKGKLISFEPQPGFWKEHLQRQEVKRRWVMAGWTSGIVYILFMLYLAGTSVWQWYETGRLDRTVLEQNDAYTEAKLIENELRDVRASLDPSGNVLEVLRQIAEPRPDDVILRYFSFKLGKEVFFRGNAPSGSRATEFEEALTQNRLFKGAKATDLSRQSNGSWDWKITIPLQSGTKPPSNP
jgi:hypothetical protein